MALRVRGRERLDLPRLPRRRLKAAGSAGHWLSSRGMTEEPHLSVDDFGDRSTSISPGGAQIGGASTRGVTFGDGRADQSDDSADGRVSRPRARSLSWEPNVFESEPNRRRRNTTYVPRGQRNIGHAQRREIGREGN